MNTATATMTTEIETTETDATENTGYGKESFSISLVSPIPFLGTHNATVTLKSPKTGEHRTFKISTAKRGTLEGRRIIALMIGTDNENDYQGFGFVRDDGTIAIWSKYKKTIFEKYADLFERPVYWANRGVEYLAEARCRRCGRKLTTPQSLMDGIGPECIKKES